MKRRVTIYVEGDIIDGLQAKHANVSGLVNDFLESLPVDTEFQDYMSDLSAFKHEQRILMDEKESIEETIGKQTNRLQRIETRLTQLEDLIGRGEKVMEEVEKSKRTAILFQQMNEIIKNCGFDADTAWEYCEGILREMKELGKEMTRENFKLHVERIKVWL